MIEFDGDFELDRPPADLWPYFTDPDVLAACAPGIKEMTVVEPWQLEAVMAVKVGSVSPSFDVDVTVTTAEEPNVLEMVAVGSAARNAFEATAHMDLQPDDGGGTAATWSASAEVSGLIASLGQRALGGVVERLVSKFFADVQGMAADGEPAESTLSGAPPEVREDADSVED